MIKPIYEFLLWENCRNNCSFCFQQQKNQLTDNQKIESANQVLQFLQSDRFTKGSHVLLVGGEIFDSPSIFIQLCDFLDKIVDKMICGDIDLLYINTNLIYKRLDSVFHLLTTIQKHNLFDRLKFTTSFDLAGRFANQTLQQLMLDNLKTIKQKFPNCNIVVNTMLTKQTCQAINNHSFSVKTFMQTYDCDVNLIPYIVYCQHLAAERKDIFKALLTVDHEMPGYIDRYVRNFDLPQDKLLYQYDKQTNSYNFVSSDHLSCGHSENFTRYSTNGTCFICDLKEMFNYGD